MGLPIIAALASTVVGAAGAHQAGKAGEAAAGAAADTGHANIHYQTETRNINNKLMRPYRKAGKNALAGYLKQVQADKVGPDFKADPGYQFRLNQGLEATQAGVGARHGLNSGATLQALNDHGQGFASNEYSNWYNRRQNWLNRKQGVVNMGQAAAAGTVANNQATAGAIGSAHAGIAGAQMAGGNAAMGGIMGATNAINQGIGEGVGAWQFNNYLNNLTKNAPTQLASGAYGTPVSPI